MSLCPLEGLLVNNSWSNNTPHKVLQNPSCVSPTPHLSGKENLCRHAEQQYPHKYKTELCKNWEEHGYCTYGTKCRFAHGVQELNGKEWLNGKYKSRPCQAFFNTMFCPYGTRCLFKHDERHVTDISSSYYTLLNKCPELWSRVPTRRLSAFAQITLEEDETMLSCAYRTPQGRTNLAELQMDNNSQRFLQC